MSVRFSRTFRSLASYNYRVFWLGQLISISGTWMQTTAQAWLVLKLTNSPTALGTVTMLQFLPVTVLTLFGGVIADRVPRRQLVFCTQSVAALQALLLGMTLQKAARHIRQSRLPRIQSVVVCHGHRCDSCPLQRGKPMRVST